MNGDSASASEVVAGAIQDHRRGVLVGSRTFGKGVVQNVLYLDHDQAMLKITTAHYYTPSGRCIERSVGLGEDRKDAGGILPDVSVSTTDAEDLAIFTRLERQRALEDQADAGASGAADDSDGKDLALETAMRILKGEPAIEPVLDPPASRGSNPGRRREPKSAEPAPLDPAPGEKASKEKKEPGSER